MVFMITNLMAYFSLAKAPLLAYNSFVETIFVLNDCHAHASHIEMLHTPESERKLFSLRYFLQGFWVYQLLYVYAFLKCMNCRGKSDTVIKKRMHIYECLLKQMAPEHILATSAKLCADILAAAADGILDLNDSTVQCVLEVDFFAIMKS